MFGRKTLKNKVSACVNFGLVFDTENVVKQKYVEPVIRFVSLTQFV